MYALDNCSRLYRELHYKRSNFFLEECGLYLTRKKYHNASATFMQGNAAQIRLITVNQQVLN
jgi:hypothetical protein